MAIPTSPRQGAGNNLLAAVPDEEYERLQPHLESVALEAHQVLIRPHEPVSYVFFPCGGLLSYLLPLTDGTAVETAAVGREGMGGLTVFLNGDSSPFEVTCQIPGAALRMGAAAFEETGRDCPALHRLLRRYTLALLHQIARTAVCNTVHPAEQRLAKWLLLCRDRVGADAFPITQEALGLMLGVRRVTVSLEAGKLQDAGLIRYRRGQITLTDPAGLERAACEDYRLIVQEYQRLLG